MRYVKYFLTSDFIGYEYFEDDTLIGSGEVTFDEIQNSDGDMNLVDDLYLSQGYFYRLIDGHKKSVLTKYHLMEGVLNGQ